MRASESERAELLKGQIKFERAAGGGTLVLLEVPLSPS